jgi:type IV pilus assembly protein PilQ
MLHQKSSLPSLCALLRATAIVFWLAATVSCTSSSRLGGEGGDLDAELSDTSDAAEDADDALAADDSSDDQVETSDGSSQQAATEDELDEDPVETQQDNPPPVAEAEPTPEVAAAEVVAENSEAPEVVAPSDGNPATVTGLDFKGNDSGGTLVVSADKPLSFQTRRSGDSQFIIEIQDVVLPRKFQRPYDTKEFPTPISGINAYQKKGSNVARIVVQLREAVDLNVTPDGNNLLMMPSGAVSSATIAGGQDSAQEPSQDASSTSETESSLQTNESHSATPSAESNTVAVGESKSMLQSRTLDDFLNGRVRYVGRPISIQVKDADLREIFNFIAEESGLNILLSEDVTGRVTMKLRKIPWDQALVVLMQSKGLGYVRQGSILRIAPLSTIRKEVDNTRELLDSQKALQPLKVKVYPVSYALAQTLAGSVRDFLSTRGKIQADARTNTLLITDIAENIDRTMAVLRRLDTPTPQVLIEGRIVEFSTEANLAIGFDWNYTVDGYSVATNLGYNSGGTMTVNDGRKNLFSGGFGALTARLSLLESETKAKVLSAPRILALNNEAADITQTQSIPIPQAIIGGAGPAQVSFTYRDVNLALNVTPQVSNNGSILMQISIQRQFLGAAIGTSPPPVNSRSARTRVIVRNGDVAVIGGIYQSDSQEGVTSVPWLSKIPLLGAFFKTSNKTSNRNELVIFLSPRILEADNRMAGGSPVGQEL